MSDTLDLGSLIKDPATRIIVTCGSGGVGKTTTAAALAMKAAEAGRRTVVLTIDPARRLAQSMGLTELDNTPREVPGTDGNLHAMMLDMKRTFDDVVTAHSTPDRAQAIFENPFYQALSSSFAGTQEYMAMEKLGQLREAQSTDGVDTWDLIVVDTPPSRSALDFLDAPQRLGRFLDGRLIKLLTAPARVGGKAYLKVVTASFSVVTRILSKILGSALLTDVASFVSSLEAMFGGFRERADHTYQLLKAPGTLFVVVAAPEPDALREASYFVERLSADQMPLAGLVVNRVHFAVDGLSSSRAEAGAEELIAGSGTTSRGSGHRPAAGKTLAGERPERRVKAADLQLAEAALRVQVEVALSAEHDQRMIKRFASAHPEVPRVSVRALPSDVHDLDGLREIGALLTGDDS
ncbi:anion-transporting ArsA/GET3 family ATPase [Jatrophihabitans sp. GAS493]|uniref:ArsA family ATPase n=1 Tax=Jatrophihabitans sp. GAS493 TaxID=1907575 RepID=UPI000BB6F012|nr:ArsA-related P-loop ATPase [Jatrophihabitans sp. GAS493]SOD71885.1 anion-transporting ArsA/GET3 family ATPase [Jatrophihabitans sp. GAS493]